MLPPITKLIKLILLIAIIIQNLSNSKDLNTPSYIKVYRGEKEILNEMNKDFLGMSEKSSIDDLIFKGQYNITDQKFPNSELDLFSIKDEGSQFSLGEKSLVLFSSNNSVICHDNENASSYTFMNGNFTYRNKDSNTSETNQFKATIISNDIVYEKNYTMNKENNTNKIHINFTGGIAFSWDSPSLEFSNQTSENAKQFVAKKFEEFFYKNYSMQIQNELDKGLKEYYKGQHFNTKLNFILSDYLSQLKSINHTVDLNLRDFRLNYNETETKLMQKRDYTGYYSSYDSVVNKTLSADFDIYKSNVNTKNLKNAVFLDKFLFEYLLETYEFKNFFIRRELNQMDLPKALNLDLSIRQVSKILPEVTRLFPLTKKANVNFAFFSPQITFRDNDLPQLTVKLDFTFYVRDFEGNFKQIFTAQNDLVFDIKPTFTYNKDLNLLKNKGKLGDVKDVLRLKGTGDYLLNFIFDLAEMKNFKLSENFSFVDIDYLKYLIEEVVSYGIEKNGSALIEKDLDLSVLFEGRILARYYESGILLYEYRD